MDQALGRGIADIVAELNNHNFQSTHPSLKGPPLSEPINIPPLPKLPDHERRNEFESEIANLKNRNMVLESKLNELTKLEQELRTQIRKLLEQSEMSAGQLRKIEGLCTNARVRAEVSEELLEKMVDKLLEKIK